MKNNLFDVIAYTILISSISVAAVALYVELGSTRSINGHECYIVDVIYKENIIIKDEEIKQ